MVKAIQDGKCAASPDNKEPSTDFSHEWAALRQYNGKTGCPIDFKRTWHYLAIDRELLYTHGFSTTNPDFHKTSGIDGLYGDGSLYVIPRDKNGVTKILGDLQYNKLQVDSLGKLQVIIQTQQSYKGAGGNGEVRITIKSDLWAAGGGVRWDGSDFSKRTYFLDSGDIEQKRFNELFSFFALDKIVDDSERMR
jgi:hypothetical protein